MVKYKEETGQREYPTESVPVKPEKGKRIRSKKRVEMPAEDNGKKVDAGGQAATSGNEAPPFLRLFAPPVAPPKYDKDREKRLQRTARVNALGDFLRQLGTLAGGGYVSVSPYQESKYLTKANAEIDRMRKQYEADRRRYINRGAAIGKPSGKDEDAGETFRYKQLNFN